jgi:hypothetical protein
MPHGKPVSPHAKTRNWTLPTVLGLIVSVVGSVGVIELRPQLSMSPKEQLVGSDPLSAPFELTNTGYLSTHIVNIIAILHHAECPSGGGHTLTIDDGQAGNIEWDNFDLQRGGKKTIIPYFVGSYGVPGCNKADMVIAVDYDFLWIKWRWFFRFVGVRLERWDWEQQPLERGLKHEINAAVEKGLAQHRKYIAGKK